MSTALGVSANMDGVGLSPADHRKIIDAQWNNTGIIRGLGINGRPDMRYQVNAGVCVCQRANGDGKTVAYYPGGVSGVVSNGSSNPRIDAIWIKANNQVEFKDDNNSVIVGVSMGAAASNPTPPTVPEYATVLCYMKVPANATNTNACTRIGEIDYAIPYGANLGLLGSSQERRDFELANTGSNKWNGLKTKINIPTDRMLRIMLIINFHAKGSNGGTDMSKVSEMRCQLRIDGVAKNVMHNFVSYGSWTSHEFIISTPCGRGEHVIDLLAWIGYGVPAMIHYHGGEWEGMQLKVFDDGPQQ